MDFPGRWVHPSQRCLGLLLGFHLLKQLMGNFRVRIWIFSRYLLRVSQYQVDIRL